jgi:hypothetical protein
VIGAVDDGNKHSEDFIVKVIEWSNLISIQVAIPDGELDPHLSFGCFAFRIRQFADECRSVSALPPSFRKISANRTR